MVLTSPLWADSNRGTPENPECTKNGDPVIPNEFIDELERELAIEQIPDLDSRRDELDPVEKEVISKLGGFKEIISERDISIGVLKQRPDFQDRLEWWRILHGLAATVDCTIKSDARIAPLAQKTLATSVGGITTVPQHSLANNIFRNKEITLWLYDRGRRIDGDIVDVYFNGAYLGRTALPPLNNAVKLTLSLRSSFFLNNKPNILKFVGVSSGTSSDGVVTLGVRGNQGEIFDGSLMAGNGARMTFYPGETRAVNLALGSICVDAGLYPESAKHIKEAWQAGRPRILTIDRLGANARRVLVDKLPAMKKCRAANKGTGNDCDEYPQVMFQQNGERPHIKAIPLSDNRGSGATIKNYASPHGNGGQVEMVVPNGALQCRNAF